VQALTPAQVASLANGEREGPHAAQQRSPLARRPYDLRHAAVSLWLNAGVSAPQVAEWAGHSVHVLMKVYAKCIDGQQEAAMRQITAALAEHRA
jgi:integrase